MNDIRNLLFELQFTADYHGEKQRARLNAHLDQGRTIASFLYDENERHIDEHIVLLRRAHETVKELSEQANKPLWHHILKK
jgi:hypothetical protein